MTNIIFASAVNMTGEEKTRERISSGHAFVLERDGEIIATALLKMQNRLSGRNTAYVNQVAVLPKFKRQRLGSLLMDLCESVARENGCDGVQLDTAQPAAHLVAWYQSRGYKIIGEHQFEGKTYASWILEKEL